MAFIFQYSIKRFKFVNYIFLGTHSDTVAMHIVCHTFLLSMGFTSQFKEHNPVFLCFC